MAWPWLYSTATPKRIGKTAWLKWRWNTPPLNRHSKKKNPGAESVGEPQGAESDSVETQKPKKSKPPKKQKRNGEKKQ